MRQGHDVCFLLNLVLSENGKCCFHGTGPDLLKEQASCLGIPIIQQRVSSAKGDYEKNFKHSLSLLRDTHGIEAVVFGDIYLDDHKAWVERVCDEIGLQALEPLWQDSTETIITEFLEQGFNARIVSAKADIFDSAIIGKALDSDFIMLLKEKQICLCGENGEFHTFVCDGPCFKRKILLRQTESHLIEGFWKHWQIDIKSFNIADKHTMRHQVS